MSALTSRLIFTTVCPRARPFEERATPCEVIGPDTGAMRILQLDGLLSNLFFQYISVHEAAEVILFTKEQRLTRLNLKASAQLHRMIR